MREVFPSRFQSLRQSRTRIVLWNDLSDKKIDDEEPPAVSEESGIGINREAKQSEPVSSSDRAQDAIYQKGTLVGRVVDAEVDREAKQIRFGEIYGSDHLMIPEECEFQDYRVIIQKILFASNVEKQSGHRGRVLRDCVADILGHRQL